MRRTLLLIPLTLLSTALWAQNTSTCQDPNDYYQTDDGQWYPCSPDDSYQRYEEAQPYDSGDAGNQYQENYQQDYQEQPQYQEQPYQEPQYQEPQHQEQQYPEQSQETYQEYYPGSESSDYNGGQSYEPPLYEQENIHQEAPPEDYYQGD